MASVSASAPSASPAASRSSSGASAHSREFTRAVAIVPLSLRSLQRELSLFMAWYNADRPHTTLQGATPDEVYFGRRPAFRQPRFEPRPGWPRASPCAAPRTLVKGQPGV